MKLSRLYGFGAVIVLFSLVFYACSKNDSTEQQPLPPGSQQVSLYLTDDPGFFDNVMVDIKSVKVLIDTCSKDNRGDDDDDDDDDDNGRGNHHDWDDDRNDCVNWQSLEIKPGVYDLLTLRNGTDTLLANGIIPKGKIRRIKIELGENNSLVKDSITYPLKLWPGLSSTILISVKGGDWDEYQPDRFRLWLDFDVTRSVVRVRDGVFYLKPVIHLFTVKATGSVAGRIEPKDAWPVISVYNESDTAYALPWHNGQWKARGLKQGTYTVFVNASNGYSDTTITGVEVTAGKETNLNKIILHK
ncbi:DUF4382 domain-containing protein [Pseudobacter ginsenosidimutans]|uniref:Uncharacterized protein DUF4382 n=1 Tax=Pseudobacter ginsenosidimutans TaxID=661488 RepID=A0A4V2EZ34_9BACT|nr:DUF4382 domain-containing protein [Pseudobacter ginsenosidimutans]QEC42742.1 DUF4382 domain-containing protein [Pseudobacter ginsenosidimutans]RZS65100.1 uncharacterized protein DUF4382 [Pseudobacter ginsenosidimutans]